MKVVFMGTPEYSVPTLKALLDSEHEVIAVYTKVDKPKGRGKKVEITPIKALAEEYNIPVYQPVTLKTEESIAEFQSHPADIAVVIAYGLILPAAVLNAYPMGCMNLHASLLPKFRGASPIQAAILAGEEKTGVTSMQMDEGLDTGAMLLKEEILLTGKETAGELHDALAEISAKLCLQTLKEIEAGTICKQLQPSENVSYAGKITKEMGRIDWTKSSMEIDRQIRGLSPWPSAYTNLQGKNLKIWKAARISDDNPTEEAGTVIGICDQGITVACGQGSLLIQELQLEGKKRMRAVDFLNGHSITVGQMLRE